MPVQCLMPSPPPPPGVSAAVVYLRQQAVQDRIDRPVKHAMIDKSKAEISALASLGIFHFLCLFHKLQEWERFLKKSESGVKDPEERLGVLWALKELAQTKDKDWFKTKQEEFKDM